MAPTLRSASISYHFLPYTTIDIIIPLASSSTYIPTRVLHLYLTSIITNIGDRPGFINFVVLTTGNTQPGRSLTLLGFHNATVTTIVSKTDPLTVAQDLRSRGEYSYPSHITTVVLPPLEPTDLSGLLYNIPDLVNKAIANQHEYGAGDLCTQYRHKDVWVVSGDCATHYKERTGWSLLLDNVTSTPPQPSEHPHSVHQAPSSSPAPSSPTTIPIFPTLNLLFPPLPPPHTTCLTVSYDDSRFLPALLLTYLPSICTSAILLVGTTPWDTHGSANEPRTMTPTVIRLSRAITKLEKQGYNEVSVVRGSWPNEAAQRNAGQQLARMRGATSVFVVDGDEYYEVEEIQRILELNEQSRKGRYEQLIASEAARIASLISHYDIPTTPTTIVSSTVPPSLYATPFLFSPMLTYVARANRASVRAPTWKPGRIEQISAQLYLLSPCSSPVNPRSPLSYSHSRSLRSQVLRRDEFRCRSARETHGPVPCEPHVRFHGGEGVVVSRHRSDYVLRQQRECL